MSVLAGSLTLRKGVVLVVPGECFSAEIRKMVGVEIKRIQSEEVHFGGIGFRATTSANHSRVAVENDRIVMIPVALGRDFVDSGLGQDVEPVSSPRRNFYGIAVGLYLTRGRAQ